MTAGDIQLLRNAVKVTVELEDSFLQEETFKHADPKYTAALAFHMQIEWKLQLISYYIEIGQRYVCHPRLAEHRAFKSVMSNLENPSTHRSSTSRSMVALSSATYASSLRLGMRALGIGHPFPPPTAAPLLAPSVLPRTPCIADTDPASACFREVYCYLPSR
jgi:hypothetical protein